MRDYLRLIATAALVYASLFLIGRFAGERVDAVLYYLALFTLPAWAASRRGANALRPWAAGLVVALLFVAAGLAWRYLVFHQARAVCGAAPSPGARCLELQRQSDRWPLERTLAAPDTYIALALALAGGGCGAALGRRRRR